MRSDKWANRALTLQSKLLFSLSLGLPALLGSALAVAQPVPANPQPPPPKAMPTNANVRTYICPIDGSKTQPIGTDGKPSPKMYSDLEIPTQAYTNLIVACLTNGYANWTDDFEKPVSGDVQRFVQTELAATAKRVSEPLVAWAHHIKLLRYRRASPREMFGALLTYSYVQKRARPSGGQDHALERKIRDTRKEVLALLDDLLKVDPPKTLRSRLEWIYLHGELTRLTGDAKTAAPRLKYVCDQQENAGYTIGQLACSLADRAAHGETWEEYRSGQFDISVVPDKDPPPPDPNKKPAETKPAPPKVEAAPPAKPLPPMAPPPPPRAPDDGAAPPPPPPIPG